MNNRVAHHQAAGYNGLQVNEESARRGWFAAFRIFLSGNTHPDLTDGSRIKNPMVKVESYRPTLHRAPSASGDVSGKSKINLRRRRNKVATAARV